MISMTQDLVLTLIQQIGNAMFTAQTMFMSMLFHQVRCMTKDVVISIRIAVIATVH